MPQGKGFVHLPSPLPANWVPNRTAYRCPYCGVLSTLTPVAWTYEHWICQCDNPKCKKIFYAKVQDTGGVSSDGARTFLSFDVLETYPKYVPEKHDSIPQYIWNDYSEGCKAFDVGAYKASMVMCRRVLQNVCLEKGATKKDDKGRWIRLNDQIKQAFPQKDYSLIHSIADRVKYFGDYGAHPQDDNIDDVTQESAKTILEFSYKILEIGYIIPWGLKKLST